MTPRKIDRVEIRKDEGQLVEIAIPLITKRAKPPRPAIQVASRGFSLDARRIGRVRAKRGKLVRGVEAPGASVTTVSSMKNRV